MGLPEFPPPVHGDAPGGLEKVETVPLPTRPAAWSPAPPSPPSSSALSVTVPSSPPPTPLPLPPGRPHGTPSPGHSQTSGERSDSRPPFLLPAHASALSESCVWHSGNVPLLHVAQGPGRQTRHLPLASLTLLTLLPAPTPGPPLLLDAFPAHHLSLETSFSSSFPLIVNAFRVSAPVSLFLLPATAKWDPLPGCLRRLNKREGR